MNKNEIKKEIKEKIVLALDVDNVEKAKELIVELKDYVGVFKVGLQLYTGCGEQIIQFMNEQGAEYFFDIKLMDIPNTVKKAAENIIRQGATFFNLHALGGFEMIKQACDAAKETAKGIGAPPPTILAVTVLTSISTEVLKDDLNLDKNANEFALELASLAKKAGATGVVASVWEARKIKELLGKDFKVLCPGIRPEWSPKDDQKRLATPATAIEEGADYLVIGRAVTSAENKREAMEKIYCEIEEKMKEGK